MAEDEHDVDFLTVEEAARVLRIGRTAAYSLAKLWRETNGREGLPVVAFGRALRVPRAALEKISGAPVKTTNATNSVAKPASPTTPPASPPALATAGKSRRSRHARTRRASSDQTSFPF